MATIRATLGDLVFGEEDEELEHAVVSLLRERRLTLATAEAGTGGEIAHWLARTGEALVRAGLVGGGPADLVRLLRAESGRRHAGSTNEAQAEGLAQQARQRTESDVSLVVLAPNVGTATTGDEVVIAIGHSGGVVHKRFPLAAHPDIQQTLAAKRGLNELRLWLVRLNGQS